MTRKKYLNNGIKTSIPWVANVFANRQNTAIGVSLIIAISLSIFSIRRQHILGIAALTSSLGFFILRRGNVRAGKKWDSIVEELRQRK